MNGGDNRPHKGPRDFAEKAPPWGAPTDQGNGKLGRPAGHQANHPALTIGSRWSLCRKSVTQRGPASTAGKTNSAQCSSCLQAAPGRWIVSWTAWRHLVRCRTQLRFKR